MWTVSIFIGVCTTAAVSLLCMVSFVPKSKGKNDKGCEEDRLEEESDEMERTTHDDAEGGVKLGSRITGVDSKTTRNEQRTVLISGLDCTATFENLTPTERLYAHHTARAYFQGALLVFLQTSLDSAAIFVLLYRIFWFDSVATLKEKADALGITESEWCNFLLWSATRLTVRGVHVIPTISHVRLWKLIASSTAASIFPDLISMYEAVEKTIFSPLPAIARLGFPAPGVKTKAVTKEEYDICNAYLKKKAGEYAANESQKEMLEKFAEHFTTGGYLDYAKADDLFVKDENPTVRSRFLFKENTRCVPGNRSEFAGFVATINHNTTKKFDRLIENASVILKKLPWGKAYEKDQFKKPDFAALDMIAFGLMGIVKGQNYKNNQDPMGRNHLYSNMINICSPLLKSIKTEDKEVLCAYNTAMHEVQTGLHELLGHGSGKLFTRNEKGAFNFDKENTVDVLTGGKVKSWYEPGQSYYSVFGDLAKPFEECRAMAVAYVLCCDEEVLELMGYECEEGQSVKYAIWLRHMRDGLRALPKYVPSVKSWGTEAHSHARFVLMKVLLEAGEECLVIDETVDSDGNTDLIVNLDKSKIDSVALPAVRELLKKLQGYKSTADVKGATALFNQYAVGPVDLKWRTICLEQDLRCGESLLIVQPNTVLTKRGGVQLVTYEESAEGVIQSVIDRYTLEAVADLEELWRVEKK